jgi:heme exporter protein D
MTKQGTFLFHPITQLVTSAKTFLHYAQENGDEELIQIIEKISYNMPLLTSYHSSITQQQTWIYTHPITNNQWTLGVIFPKEDISLKPKDIRHYSFVLLTYSILYLILICLFLYSVRKIRRSTATILISITILIGLMASWYSIQKTTTSTFASDTTITDQANLDKFLDDLSEETERKHEDIPIIIPCGLLLYSIDITSPDHMTVSGYIWNRYNTKQHTDISRQIQIPHATNLQIRDPLLSKSGDWETVTWNIRGTIYQKQDYSHFPFDLQHMQITLEHYDIEKNIILVPDLAAYKKISPEDTPGIDKSITLSEFNFEKTFFNYKQITPKTNFGVPTYGKATDHFILLFNIVTTRGLLTPFIIFFLPLLVVLLSLFATLVISTQRTNPFKALAPYTGLFFSLIVLQRSLREQYPTNTTLYMEYAFFFTYITIIILVIHTIITYTHPNWHYYQKQIFPLLKFLFWPFQLISWFITTLIVFY